MKLCGAFNLWKYSSNCMVHNCNYCVLLKRMKLQVAPHVVNVMKYITKTLIYSN